MEKALDDSMQIQTFDQIPSVAEFESQIERRNVPAVFAGCVKDWKAISRWNPSALGLDYLQELVGSSMVEAMFSRSAPVFYGDIRSHERVTLPFSAFLAFCKKHIQNNNDGHNSSCESKSEAGTDEQSFLLPGNPQQIYLAQIPIMNAEDNGKVQLGTLRDDIQTPQFLGKKELAAINLWMNGARSWSSTHYDPHHNLLCMVSGCKQVVLWPPSASPFLYPMPVYGEASNHSSVSLEKPDFSIHPRAECLRNYSQKVILYAGDALFIPEGWFHQVDSNDLTIAVNFWWRSSTMLSMLEHMDAYYLRRILSRMVDKQMNQVLCTATSAGIKDDPLLSSNEMDHQGHALDLISGEKDFGAGELRQDSMLHKLEPPAIQALHDLVSLIHDRVNFTDQCHPVESSSKNESAACEKGDYKKLVTAKLYCIEDDPVAKIIWSLGPLTLYNVFLAMVKHFPKTLEALILHLLSPVGAEVLTRKFDEMDNLLPEEERSNFYRLFYSSFDDQLAAMNSILNGKESFAFQAFKTLLDQYLGVDVNGSSASVLRDG